MSSTQDVAIDLSQWRVLFFLLFNMITITVEEVVVVAVAVAAVVVPVAWAAVEA